MPESDAREIFQKAIDEKNGGKPDEPEQELWRGVYSAKGMFGSLFLAAAASIGVLVLLLSIELFRSPTAWWTGLILIGLAWAYLLSLLAYRKFTKSYILTNQRLKHRDGLLFRTMNRIELLDVDDVQYKQGPVEQLLNVGNITVKSTDLSHPVLILMGIADVRKVADLIDNARRAERRRRGVQIVQ